MCVLRLTRAVLSPGSFSRNPDDGVALIELTDVSKTYDLGEVQVEALKHATISIERGEYVALIGPSGSGKSTLMNTLGCLDRPTGGSYKLDGQEVSTMSANERAALQQRHLNHRGSRPRRAWRWHQNQRQARPRRARCRRPRR